MKNVCHSGFEISVNLVFSCIVRKIGFLSSEDNGAECYLGQLVSPNAIPDKLQAFLRSMVFCKIFL